MISIRTSCYRLQVGHLMGFIAQDLWEDLRKRENGIFITYSLQFSKMVEGISDHGNIVFSVPSGSSDGVSYLVALNAEQVNA